MRFPSKEFNMLDRIEFKFTYVNVNPIQSNPIQCNAMQSNAIKEFKVPYLRLAAKILDLIAESIWILDLITESIWILDLITETYLELK